MEGLSHLLSLKVMRVSRPSLASAWEPFYSSSPSFSAHSTASILSLQGKTPLDGHPKTLRDLAHASEMLTLPAAFGSIQLGETFSSCLCVNNEASVDIHGVSLKVEIQTATSKLTLAEFGGDHFQLGVGRTVENVVHHEIKELGQHVLGCTVTYRVPSNVRNMNVPVTPLVDQNVQSFRKFYKFVVTNPLSVKTKVYVPRSPSALFSAVEREKVFLEVHIQNMTQEALWFERMRLECVDGWQAEDANTIATGTNREKESIFVGPTGLMHPQDTRQYIYILQPVSAPPFPVTHEPGSSIPFGRLDISWRSAFGEPGRLLTSMLSRRIPVVPPLIQAPVSALPSYLKRSATSAIASSRPQSPQATQARAGTPPPVPRPASPFRGRVQVGVTKPHSPDVTPSQAKHILPSDSPSDVRVDLLLRKIDRESITVEKPFSLQCSLIVSVPNPSSAQSSQRRRRLTLAVQHVQPPRVPAISSSPETQMSPPSAYPIYKRQSLSAAPSQSDATSEQLGSAFTEIPLLPAPFAEGGDESKFMGSAGVAFLGNSSIPLDPIILLPEKGNNPVGTADGDGSGDPDEDEIERLLVVRSFELSYMPLRTGFSTFGGLRVLLLEDMWIAEDEPASVAGMVQGEGISHRTLARVLEEWGVIGEIWVQA